MKRLFTFLALVLGLVSCQTEGFDVNVGGEQDVNITVSLPEGTRANSALGAFDNVDFKNYDVRFQCEVHYNGKVKVLPVQYGRGDDAVATATFPVRLIANRDYKFVVWADLVNEDSEEDLHYNTSAGLHNITIKDWNAMDETRDAFTCSAVRNFNRSNAITLELTRPFAKLRVITTDIEELMGIVPTEAEVVYTTEYRNSFNAVEAKAGDVYATKTHNRFEIASYGETGTDKTLFADYLFASEGDIVNFSMNVYDQNRDLIDEQKNFNTPIPVKRNYVTTIKGNILTYADDFTVTINDAFENADDKIDDAPYYQEVISSAAELFSAFEHSGNYILNEDLYIDSVPATISRLAATRAAVETIVDLNGKTITVENKGQEALHLVENGETITFVGEGTIELTEESTAPFIENEGTVEVTSGEVINNEVLDVDVFSVYVNYVDELRKAFETGGEYTMVYDVVYPETLVLEAGKSLILNLNGKTISQTKECTGNYNMVYNKGELTINGDGAISFKDTGAGDPTFGWGSYTLRNEGTLVVNDATIEHLGEQNPGNGQPNVHMYCAIFQYSGKSTINGGVISTPTYRSARLWNGEMTINGGQFVGQLWLQAVSDNANLVINGGEFAPRGNDGSSVFVTNSGKAVKCSINGGFFYNKVGMSEPIACIAGGEFTPAAKEATSEGLLAEGYEFAELENGNWTVVYVIYDKEGLMSFANAVDNGNTFEGKLVKLDADIDLEGETWDPIGDNRKDTAFSGTFDGQNHTIKGLSKSSFDGSDYGNKEGWGLFSVVDGATIKNVNIDNATFGSYSVISGAISGYTSNTTFENINITNTKIAGYNWYTGGVTGWASGECTFKGINLDSSVAVGTLWDSHGQNAGGIAGGVSGSGTYIIEDCNIACVMDVINDVTSNYKWCVYRVSGMIIGNTNTTETKYNEVVTATATNVTCKNVTVTYGEWMNYHYCEGFWNRGWGRYESSDYVGGADENESHNHAEGEEHCECFPFDQLFGGSSNGSGHYPVKGLAEFPGVTVNYPAKYTCPICGEEHGK